MRIRTPGEVAALTQNKYLGVLVAARFARFVNEFPRDRSVDFEEKLTTSALDELARLALSFNQMAAQLERIEQMRQRLIGDVAHELHTPLTTIKGTAEGLIDGVLIPEPEVFLQIYREADRLQRLVQDLQEAVEKKYKRP